MSMVRQIAMASLLAGLVGVAPVVPLTGVAPAIAQPVDPRKAEGDRLLQRGIELEREGIKLRQNSYYQASTQSLEKPLDLYRQLQDRSGEIHSRAYLGAAQLSLGTTTKAVEISQQVVATAREIKSPDLKKLTLEEFAIAQKPAKSNPQISQRRPEIFDLMRQGVQQFQSGQFEAAIQTWQQVLELSRSTRNLPSFLEELSLEQLGVAHLSMSNYGKVIEYQEQRLALARKRQNLVGEGRSLSVLGATYFYLGNYGKAIEYYERYLAIIQYLEDRLREGTAAGDLGLDYPQGKGIALSNLGLAYRALSNYSRAIEYLGQAVVSTRSRRDQRGEGKMLVDLGDVHLALSNFTKSIEYYEQSLGIARKIRDRSAEGLALGKLGVAYLYTRNNAKATAYQAQSLVALRESKDRQNESVIWGEFGRAYAELNYYDEAIASMKQELAIVQEFKDRQREGITLHNLGMAFFGLGNAKASEEALFRSIEVLESIRQSGLGGNDANKISIFETQVQTYRLLQRVLVARNKPNMALEISERGRSRAFVDLLAQRLAIQANIKFPNIEKIQQVAKQQNATLVQYSVLYNQINVQGKRDLRQAELYIWVIQPSGKITFRQVDLIPLWQQQDSSLAALVNQSREMIGARGRSDIPVALSPERSQQLREQQTQKLKQLHQLLIAPIASLLPKDPNQRVIFIPQNELFLVPFPALLDANNQPLIEKHTMLTAPSIQVLELTRQQRDRLTARRSTNQKSLIVGNPVMPKVVTRVGDPPVQLSNLPGAKQEALEIAELFNTQAITGAQATETAIAQQMPNARIIHLATHGLLDDTKGLGVPGAIALAPTGNGQLNDGLLTSDEILDMQLNAELVVLSACDTGRGRITGDGVIGLSRSLITAGVPSIIVSLWKVPDDQTALLMTEFYKNLQRSPDKAQALRQAMLTTKKQYPDPLNWAAFTLIGEAESPASP